MNNKEFQSLSDEVKLSRLKEVISLVAPNLELGKWVNKIPLHQQMKVVLANEYDLLSKARTYSTYGKYSECIWLKGEGFPGNECRDPEFDGNGVQVVYINFTDLTNPLKVVRNYNTLLIYIPI